MGVLTGLAIAIHNFPEGIATFVGTLSSLSLGAVLALAIAIHNIPEGICVAMPVYYATGSKWKGVFWASLSGFAEPLGRYMSGHSYFCSPSDQQFMIKLNASLTSILMGITHTHAHMHTWPHAAHTMHV